MDSAETIGWISDFSKVVHLPLKPPSVRAFPARFAGNSLHAHKNQMAQPQCVALAIPEKYAPLQNIQPKLTLNNAANKYSTPDAPFSAKLHWHSNC
jgi:hypothetical protein